MNGIDMINNTTLNWPAVIEFGLGKIQSLMEHLEGCRRVFFLIDVPIKSKIDPVLAALKQRGLHIMVSTEVVPEPPFAALAKLLPPVKEFGPDAVVGIGGGSAIDLAKLVAVLFNGKQQAPDVVGIGKVNCREVKLITATTTSGTGSEVTPIAVLTDVENKTKKGVVSKFLVPDVAIIDPELTFSVPAPITAATGVDAMTHCIEAYTNRFSHPVIDNIALEGIRLIAANLERAVKNGMDQEARAAMALGSLYGGLCLGPVNTAGVHAMAYPLGGEFKIPHGVANSVLLPFVMHFNLSACTQKYANIATAVGVPQADNVENLASQGIMRIRQISQRAGIPSSIKELGIPETAIPAMAEAALKVTRLMNNNPRTISLTDAEKIYRRSFRGEFS
jgi:alcohol dehydrogenase class IV